MAELIRTQFDAVCAQLEASRMSSIALIEASPEATLIQVNGSLLTVNDPLGRDGAPLLFADGDGANLAEHVNERLDRERRPGFERVLQLLVERVGGKRQRTAEDEGTSAIFGESEKDDDSDDADEYDDDDDAEEDDDDEDADDDAAYDCAPLSPPLCAHYFAPPTPIASHAELASRGPADIVEGGALVQLSGSDLETARVSWLAKEIASACEELARTPEEVSRELPPLQWATAEYNPHQCELLLRFELILSRLDTRAAACLGLDLQHVLTVKLQYSKNAIMAPQGAAASPLSISFTQETDNTTAPSVARTSSETSQHTREADHREAQQSFGLRTFLPDHAQRFFAPLEREKDGAAADNGAAVLAAHATASGSIATHSATACRGTAACAGADAHTNFVVGFAAHMRAALDSACAYCPVCYEAHDSGGSRMRPCVKDACLYAWEENGYGSALSDLRASKRIGAFHPSNCTTMQSTLPLHTLPPPPPYSSAVPPPSRFPSMSPIPSPPPNPRAPMPSCSQHASRPTSAPPLPTCDLYPRPRRLPPVDAELFFASHASFSEKADRVLEPFPSFLLRAPELRARSGHFAAPIPQTLPGVHAARPQAPSQNGTAPGPPSMPAALVPRPLPPPTSVALPTSNKRIRTLQFLLRELPDLDDMARCASEEQLKRLLSRRWEERRESVGWDVVALCDGWPGASVLREAREEADHAAGGLSRQSMGVALEQASGQASGQEGRQEAGEEAMQLS